MMAMGICLFQTSVYEVTAVPGAEVHLSANNYTPVGDLVTVAICWVMLFLIAFSYVRKTPAFRVFRVIIPTLMLSALLNITYNQLAQTTGATPVVYIIRCLFHTALFTVFFLFSLYITEVARLEKKATNRILIAATAVLLGVMIGDAISSIQGYYESGPGGELSSKGALIFIAGYLLFTGANIVLLFTVRRRVYKRVLLGFCSSVAMSFIILLIQGVMKGSSSFTVSSFLFPVIAMLYFIHANPYNVETGTIDGSGLADIVRFNYEKKKSFIFMSLYLPTFSGEGKELPDSIRARVREFAVTFFRGALVFQLGNGHLLLVFRKDQNPDFEHRIGKSLNAFKDYHRLYQYDYKIIIGESIDQVSRKNEYASFLRNVQRTMPVNTIHRISPDDIVSFDRSGYILSQLENIHNRHDLDDSRVLVYCQPVYNVRTGCYDTAEALMRLQLEELGLVLPDQFIFLAEDNGYIHTLTEIILHKTCEEIRRLNSDGYEISRISVNVSMLEMKSDRFCEDITNIISDSGISSDKVAIELTESQNESEFDTMKSKIFELKDKGIKFYLDDFGTGYSNMERIIELPFDIIKFDRSLVIASGHSKRSEKIVHNMASLFSDLNYPVLFEGIENETDEALCRGMSASYLQGYKFSRPVPIADLRRFLDRKDHVI